MLERQKAPDHMALILRLQSLCPSAAIASCDRRLAQISSAACHPSPSKAHACPDRPTCGGALVLIQSVALLAAVALLAVRLASGLQAGRNHDNECGV